MGPAIRTVTVGLALGTASETEDGATVGPVAGSADGATVRPVL